MVSLFCRHNRFTADCPICSKGTVLDRERSEPATTTAGRKSPSRRTGRAPDRGGRSKAAEGGEFRGPYATAGPYDRDGDRYEVRLERVPGGLRLAEWAGGLLLRRAPVLAAGDLPGLIAAAAEREVASAGELTGLLEALDAPADAPPTDERPFGASPGRAGDMREELRVEPLGEGLVRIGRWMHRPGSGWSLKEAPTMYPASRYEEALADAAGRGVLSRGR